jgi:phosphonoacetate hydrolase
MKPQRVVVGLLDGLGPDYFTGSAMPALTAMAREGIGKEVEAVFPTVTNVNNVSICCGAWPAAHGISANSYYDAARGEAVYMNAASLVRTPTLFERAGARGVRSALLTCKRKTVELLHRGATWVLAAEAAPPDVVARYGAPGDIYSAGINHWLWTVAIDLLRTRPDLGVLYVHTTDYPMHRWAPQEPESRSHLEKLDALLGEARAAAPDAAFLFTADHGMNAKRRCWDPARVCAEAGVPLRFALSPERDYYVVHHRNFTGCSWLWLRSPGDEAQVREAMSALPGVEGILGREEAAARFRQPADRIGDLTVLGDADTMFGELDRPGEELSGYRAHGSLHELRVPLVVHGAQGAPGPEWFRNNLDLARWAFSEA